MPRLKQVPRSEAAPEVVEAYDRVFGAGVDPVATPGSATGTPGTWWTTYANHPGVLKALSAFSMNNTKVSAKLRELGMTRAGYLKGSQFVYSQHIKGARRAGLTEEQVQAIAYWNVANCFSDIERAVLALADGMVLEAGRVHDKVFEILKKNLADDEIIELTYLINAFASHATSCKTLRMEYDDVPDRIVEIPVPKTKRAQNHLDPSSWDK